MTDPLRTEVQWQNVECDRCGRKYQCTPGDDHYETPQGDHCCELCLLGGKPLLYLIEQEDGTVAGPYGPLAPLPTGPEGAPDVAL